MKRAQFELHALLERDHWWFAARRRIMRAIVRQVAPPDAASLILDVGCGTGANIASLADTYECVGIDASEDAIRLARQRFPGIRFVLGYAPAAVPDEIGRAAVLIIMDVLEHVPDDFQVVSSLLAALPPGAHMLITVPADARLWSTHDVSFGHYRRYDPRRLSETWRGLPVRVRLLSHFNTRLYPVVRSVRAVGRALGRASGQENTDLAMPPALLNRALRSIFAGEASSLLRALDGGTAPYRRGVSLIALLQRGPGEIVPRARPGDVPPDAHAPAPDEGAP